MFRIWQLLENDDDIEYVKGLYDRLENRLFWVAMAILKNQQDAEDAVQESFCGLIDRMDELPREQLDADAYLLTSVRNNACKIYNRKKKRKTSPIMEEELSMESPLLEHCMLQELKQHIMKLDPRSRKVFYLRVGFGMDYDAIGQEMDLSEANVRQILSRTRKKLHDMYEG